MESSAPPSPDLFKWDSLGPNSSSLLSPFPVTSLPWGGPKQGWSHFPLEVTSEFSSLLIWELRLGMPSSWFAAKLESKLVKAIGWKLCWGWGHGRELDGVELAVSSL
jgi:hypothetical protein